MRALIDREIDALIREADDEGLGTSNTTLLLEAYTSTASYTRGRGATSPVRVRVAGAARPRRRGRRVKRLKVSVSKSISKPGTVTASFRKVAPPTRPTGYSGRPMRSGSYF